MAARTSIDAFKRAFPTNGSQSPFAFSRFRRLRGCRGSSLDSQRTENVTLTPPTFTVHWPLDRSTRVWGTLDVVTWLETFPVRSTWPERVAVSDPRFVRNARRPLSL